MRLVCISDTHTLHSEIDIPDGDVLIHAGDFCSYGQIEEYPSFNTWLNGLPHKHKILIAGNHDKFVEKYPNIMTYKTERNNFVYLQDQSHTIDGIKFYGSPWQPEFYNWAFNLPRNGAELQAKWDNIPSDTDVLITHGPPHGILDLAPKPNGGTEHVGCELLRKRVMEVKPKFHIFGHIHEGYGTEEHDGTTFINACTCDGNYRPVNKPIIIDLGRLIL